MEATASTQAATGKEVRPFTIDVPEEQLADLRRRINATKWPDRETDASQGVQLETIQALASYWATDYDWRKFEERFAALPHFITEIDGVDIHFIHVRSEHEDALPLIVTHGWPGSTIEQLKIIDPLTNPTGHGASASDAFHLVIPSLAGPRVLGEADRDRLGPHPHRPGLGRADEPARLHEVRRAGRRLGQRRHRADGPAEAAGIARHPHEHAGDGSARHLEGDRDRRSAAGRPLGRREEGVRGAGPLLRDRRRLRQRDGQPAADALRHRGLTGRPGRLDARSRRRAATSSSRAPSPGSPAACRETTCSTTSPTTG